MKFMQEETYLKLAVFNWKARRHIIYWYPGESELEFHLMYRKSHLIRADFHIVTDIGTKESRNRTLWAGN